MCKMSKQIPTILFIKSFHPPDFSLVLRPPFEVHQTCRWCVCVSVSVSPSMPKENIRNWFSPCCTASSSPLWYPRNTPTLQRLDGPLKKPSAFQLEARSTAARILLHIWIASEPLATVKVLHTMHTPRTNSDCATVTIAHRDSLFTIWKDLKVHIISDYN